ncbi:MAG: glutaminyl-peptide cyclotransferase [Anaerolineae bacterium]|nr:glutaminyl-peptide cyclotransferase [Anaerolineae bacterium]MDW8172180.1 glutaminyl-peptide cyclotransferase [Anaerolineae bacterium]
MTARLARLTILLSSTLLALGAVAQAQSFSFATPARLVPQVLATYPHDPQAFTQGLLWHDGVLYESTGLRGQSSLRRVDLQSGEVLERRPVSRPAEQLSGPNALPDYFAEGLALVDGRLIQLTWTEGEAFVYDLATFERLDTYTYEGEGWGLCYDGRYLYHSDGTPYLSLRDPQTFELIVKFAVTIQGQTLAANLLNELECVGDLVYGNLWQTDFIVQIDKRDGQVVGIIDARELLTAEERAALSPNAVLNGIAHNPETDTFYITGKLWPKLYEVRFVPMSG